MGRSDVLLIFAQDSRVMIAERERALGRFGGRGDAFLSGLALAAGPVILKVVDSGSGNSRDEEGLA
jgi:hypothetical protein